MEDQHTPGHDIIDLRDVRDEFHRIVGALRDASAERDADAIEENENDPRGDDRCSNECVCTVAEKIDAYEFEGAFAMFEDDEALHDLAGVDYDEIEYVRHVLDLEREIGDLDSAANNEPVMIAETYFVEYAEQFAEDVGYINTNGSMGWPFTHIDWEGAARDLKMDYMSCDFGGHEYWRLAH